MYRKSYHNNNANGNDFWFWFMLLIGVTCFPYITIPIVILWLLFGK